MRNTQLYNSWKGMKERCNNRNHKDWHSYGGKGIRVNDEWNMFAQFKEWAINHGYKKGLTIDRLDNNKNYCPENCKWSTHAEQSLNTKKNLLVEINGTIKPLMSWVKTTELNYGTVRSRYRYGIRGEALLAPITRYSVPLIRKRRKDYGIKKTCICNYQQGKLRENAVCN